MPIRFPIELQVKQRTYGAERRVIIQYQDSSEKFTESQDWRIEAIRICSDLRERLPIKGIQETQVVGHIEVDPETFNWEFIPGEG